MSPTPTPDGVREAELLAADAIGDVIEFWGFRKGLGRIWTILFLRGEVLPADALAECLQMSAGTTSMALNELQEWGVVRRVWRPGQRKEFFEAETNLWKMISKVISERERFLVRSVRDRLERANDGLAACPPSPELRRSQERLGQLLAFVSVGQSLIEAFIVSRRADFSLVGDLLEFPARARRRKDKR